MKKLIKPLHTLIKYSLLTLSLLLPLAAQALAPLELDGSQKKTAAEIVAQLHKHHYKRQELNDELSVNFLENYLESLDPGKSYFLQSDIAAFNKHKNTFDDDFKKGDLTQSFAIFDVYRQRISDRIEANIAQLKNKDYRYNFTLDESLKIDRDEAHWPANAAAANELWRKQIKSSLLNLKLTDKSLEDSREVLLKRYQSQLRRVGQQTAEDAFTAVINVFTMLYDPHTNYFSPRMLENFNIRMSLSLEGIGAMLQSEDEYTKVLRLVPAGPADKQGQLKPSDRIVAVGQGKDGAMVDVVGWRLDDVVDLIRGKKGTTVRLEALSGKAAMGADTHIVKIVRDKVKLEEQSAQKAIFEIQEGEKTYHLGVIDIPTFYMDFEAYRKRDPNYKSTTRDVLKLLNELIAKNVDGIIIDLRNNGGGSLQEATTLTDLFIDQGPVVQIRQTNQLISRNYRSRSPAAYRGPIVILINRLSASASEIFAGAIQDYGRGIIIGSQSFGKGSVQSLQPLKKGQLKITESKFYRVSGESTQHRGVLPDITLPSLVDPDDVGESSYEHALPWDKIHAAKHAHYYNIPALLANIETQHEQRMSNNPDFIFIQGQQKLIAEASNKTLLSLREATRISEKNDYEKKILALENRRRVAKGEQPFATYADINGDESDEDEESTAATPNKIDPENDPYLTEAGHILLNFIKETNIPKNSTLANF